MLGLVFIPGGGCKCDTLSLMKKYRSVAAIVLEREGKWLLVRKPRKDHAWQFPQGGVDEGETLSEAAKRELREECGDSLKIKLLPEQIAEYKYDFPSEFLRYHGEFVGASVVFFGAEWISGEPIVDGAEIIESRWCKRDEIQKLVTANYWDTIECLLGN